MSGKCFADSTWRVKLVDGACGCGIFCTSLSQFVLEELMSLLLSPLGAKSVNRKNQRMFQRGRNRRLDQAAGGAIEALENRVMLAIINSLSIH
jgi:hypothetical protein